MGELNLQGFPCVEGAVRHVRPRRIIPADPSR